MTEDKQDEDRISVIVTSGVDDKVGESFLREQRGLSALDHVHFSEKNLTTGSFSNWTLYAAEGSSWGEVQAEVLEWLRTTTPLIATIPFRFSRSLSIEAYMYDDFHFDVDFDPILVTMLSELRLTFSVSAYFFKE